MPRSERTRDRLKRLVFRNHTALSETSLQTETRYAPSDQETDPIGPNQPNLQIGASPIPPKREVHSSNSTSTELQSSGSATSSHKLKRPQSEISGLKLCKSCPMRKRRQYQNYGHPCKKKKFCARYPAATNRRCRKETRRVRGKQMEIQYQRTADNPP